MEHQMETRVTYGLYKDYFLPLTPHDNQHFPLISCYCIEGIYLLLGGGDVSF